MSFNSLIEFIKNDMWDIHQKDISRKKSYAIKQLKILILSFRGFQKDKCHIRASALTYYTLLSIVPVLALVFAIGKGFGIDQTLQLQLHESFRGHEEVLNQVITFSNNLLNRTKGGIIAGVGVAVLLWSIIKLLGNIEHSFNTIWKIKKHRTYVRKFTDYLSIALICPLLLAISGSLTVYIVAEITSMVKVPSAILVIIPSLIPYFLVWILFSFVYLIMPNCKVKIKSAIIAGIITGTIIEIIQWAYLHFQIGVTAYNAIYGSFAALPLFIILVQISWMTVLYGSEIAFYTQNIEYFEYDYSISKISNNMKKIIAIRITALIVKHFCEDLPPLSLMQISSTLEIPILLTEELIDELLISNVIVKVIDDSSKGDTTFHPAHSVDKLSIYYVINALDSRKHKELPVSNSKELGEIINSVNDFHNALNNSSSNILLKNL